MYRYFKLLNNFKACLNENILDMRKQHQRLTEEIARSQKYLLSTCKELLEKNKITIEQAKTIKGLESQIKGLEENLGQAHEDFRKLQLQVTELKRNGEIMDLPPVKKDDEIDQKLREIMIKTKVPIKFIRIGEGLYIFGSKRVHVKILNSKLVIRIGGGYMYVEEFIKLYAQQELAKLKGSKEDNPSKATEAQEQDIEIPKSLIHLDETSTNCSQLKELELLKGNEIRLMSNLGATVPNERSVTPEVHRDLNDSSFIIPYTDQTSNISIDNVFYDITPRMEFNNSSTKKRHPNSQRTKTPDPKSHFQFDHEINMRGPDFELSKKTPQRNMEIHSAREGASARSFSRR